MPTRSASRTTESKTKKRRRLSRKYRELIELLRQWSEEGDKKEQRETWEFLKKALDEGRKGYRQLFS